MGTGGSKKMLSPRGKSSNNSSSSSNGGIQWAEWIGKPIETQALFGHLVKNNPTDEWRKLEFENNIRSSSTDEASKECNLGKIRHKNVVPFDTTRVKLKGIEGIEGSDFINASFISEGPGKYPRFIATQGPMLETLNDFWRMIWEQKSRIIVMLTREEEDGRVKVDHYWPDDAPTTYGRLVVTPENVKHQDDFISQRFKVESLDETNEPAHHVTQFRYFGWPDHGVPDQTTTIRALIKAMREIDDQKSPIVAHCSAGIGRTGTFITIDFALRSIEQNQQMTPTVNIYQTVGKLREQRLGMVQQKEQYIFCYQTVVDWIFDEEGD
eukprot:TRINITY_DN1486_c0_g1_i1.p1 TRINITY_DN1486_c0_g1~~TRINITY_DN1486_c0_g1_i1.p1  ORF type:complete len:348 (+),score=51.10 TRINITY_DN1486_c0_g1_i1:75-1046(+)